MESRKWRWVSRDKHPELTDYVTVWADKRKPAIDSGGVFIGCDSLLVCFKHFHGVTGVRLKPGQCVKVEFTAKVIEDGTP